MTFDREMLHHLARLSALDIAPHEADELQADLEKILLYVTRVADQELPELIDLDSTEQRRKDLPTQTDTSPLFAVAPSVHENLFSTAIVTDSLINKSVDEGSKS